MESTRQCNQTLAPLAFSLSIRSETTAPALASNAINHFNITALPALLAVGVAAAAAVGLIALGVPSWLSLPLVIWPGYQLFKHTQPHFEATHIDGCIQANRAVLRKAVEPIDAGHFADEAAAIVKSHYRNQQWAGIANTLRDKPGTDPYLYLATVFAYAPESWNLCTRRVYDQLLAGVVPAPIQHCIEHSPELN